MREQQEDKEQQEVGQIAEQTNRLDQLVRELGQKISGLSKKLEPITRECLVEENKKNKEPETLVPLATELRHRGNEIEGMINHIDDLLSRIEL